MRAQVPHVVLAALCGLFLTTSDLEAQPADKGAGYAQAGAPNGGACQVIAGADVATPIVTSSTDSTPLCFAWHLLVAWKASGGEAVVAYSMASGVSFAAGVDATGATELVDANGPNGRAAVVGAGKLSDGETRDGVPSFKHLYRHPGARPGVCTGGVLGAAQQYVYPPCRVDGDCAAAGASGTCNLSPTPDQWRRSCGFVVAQVDTADTAVCWGVDG